MKITIDDNINNDNINNDIDVMKEYINSQNMGNIWLKSKNMRVYARKSRRYIGNRSISSLDLANIIVDQNIRGRRIFSKYLSQVHSINPWGMTYIECVTSKRFGRFLLRNGFLIDPNDSQSYYKETNHVKETVN